MNQSSTAELVTGSQLTLTYSFADMDWKGGTTLGNLGVRFANAAEGSTVSYSVDSAVINMADSGSSATSKPSSTASAGGNVSTDQIAITRSVGSGTNDYYAEYSFSITNNSSETVRGIQILIPTSGSVDVGYVEDFLQCMMRRWEALWHIIRQRLQREQRLAALLIKLVLENSRLFPLENLMSLL